MAADLGTTLYLLEDFAPSMRAVSGREALIQALVRRLRTSPGGLWYDREYGTNLCDFVHQATVSGYEIQQAAETECLKDDRVESVDATSERDGETVTMTLVITDGEGPFELVLEISAVTIAVLEIREAA